MVAVQVRESGDLSSCVAEEIVVTTTCASTSISVFLGSFHDEGLGSEEPGVDIIQDCLRMECGKGDDRFGCLFKY